MPSLKVISEHPSDQDRVFFGAWVTLISDNNEQVRYRIVGPDEISGEHYISIDSPLARALLRKTYDDKATINTEFGKRSYQLIDIEY